MTVRKAITTFAQSRATVLPESGGSAVEIEFFFDCSCAWAYLAFEQLRRLSVELDLGLALRPVLATEIFAQVNPAIAWKLPPVKQAYYEQDLKHWAAYLDMPVRTGPATLIDSRLCMTACVGAVRWGRGAAFAAAAFEAAWSRQSDIADTSVLADLWNDAGLPPEMLFATLAWPQTVQELQWNTRELMERGGFGVPSFFLEGEMFFGNDSFPLLEAAVRSLLRSLNHTA
jgi:2-hydroxychromene-2-carboxylate isomerase